MVLLSARPEAFSERDAYLVSVLATQLAPALALAGLPQGVTASAKRK
jgi:hypothetical protein